MLILNRQLPVCPPDHVSPAPGGRALSGAAPRCSPRGHRPRAAPRTSPNSHPSRAGTVKRAENTTANLVKLVISSQIKRSDSASNYRFLSHSQVGKEPHAGSSPRGDQGFQHKRNETRTGNTWPLANRPQPTPVRYRLEQAGPRCVSSAFRRHSAPRPRRATGTPGSRCHQPATEMCPGRARGAGIPRER